MVRMVALRIGGVAACSLGRLKAVVAALSLTVAFVLLDAGSFRIAAIRLGRFVVVLAGTLPIASIGVVAVGIRGVAARSTRIQIRVGTRTFHAHIRGALVGIIRTCGQIRLMIDLAIALTVAGIGIVAIGIRRTAAG